MGELKDFLASFLMPQRLARIRDVLSKRTNHITVVLEDIYDPHNASAVLRSCDAMGIQTVHIIQKRHTFQVKEGVSMGTGRWLDLRMHKETSECFDELRKNGYSIASASPPLPGTVLLPDFQSPGKTAIVLGSEKDGLSPFARENSDCLITIPMFGFAESFNLSVSGAILLYALRSRDGVPGLTTAESEALELEWIRKSLRNAEELEKAYHAKGDAEEGSSRR